MTHTEFLCSLLRSVRTVGAAATLHQVRADRPAFHGGEYHDTRAVFFVWAVDRLVQAGLSDIGVLWHPLTDRHTVEAWWSTDTLAGEMSRAGFVPSDRALATEPQPVDAELRIAA